MIILISHSSRDKDLARRIRDELEHQRLHVWLDEAEIRVGQSIPKEIGQAIENADVFCLLVSSASCSSPWVERELHAFMPRWLEGGAALVPCKLDACSLPALIRDIKYADFSSSFNIGLQELMGAVRIREETEFQAQLIREETALQTHLQRMRSKVLEKLEPIDIAFFVHHFSRSQFYFVGDAREERIPVALGVMKNIGALEVDVDRHEYLYTITPIGEKLLTIVEADAPQELLTKWDREIGPRPSKH